MKTKVYSVRLKSLLDISEKAYKAIDFNGSEDIIPKSQIFGYDSDVNKSEAYWIAAWILERKNINYSIKKAGWYNHITHRVEPIITIIKEVITPETLEAKETMPDADLIR